MVPVVFLDAPGGTFWQGWHQFVTDQLLAKKMISPEDLALYMLTDQVDEAVDEIMRFYKVYHSMRYVRSRLVFRLRQELPAALLADINRTFPDILAEGEFQQGPALKEERDEPDLADLPRLVFRFDRHSLGRLRRLIDVINRGSVGD